MAARTAPTALVLSGLAAVAVACGGGSGSVNTAPTATLPTATQPGSLAVSPGATPPASASPASTSTAPPSASAELFAFTAQTVGGEQLDASVYGGRDVAVWFWAPW